MKTTGFNLAELDEKLGRLAASKPTAKTTVEPRLVVLARGRRVWVFDDDPVGAWWPLGWPEFGVRQR